jgi:hypothetical protein
MAHCRSCSSLCFRTLEVWVEGHSVERRTCRYAQKWSLRFHRHLSNSKSLEPRDKPRAWRTRTTPPCLIDEQKDSCRSKSACLINSAPSKFITKSAHIRTIRRPTSQTEPSWLEATSTFTRAGTGALLRVSLIGDRVLLAMFRQGGKRKCTKGKPTANGMQAAVRMKDTYTRSAGRLHPLSSICYMYFILMYLALWNAIPSAE